MGLKKVLFFLPAARHHCSHVFCCTPLALLLFNYSTEQNQKTNNTNNNVPLPSLSGGSVAAVTAATNFKKS